MKILHTLAAFLILVLFLTARQVQGYPGESEGEIDAAEGVPRGTTHALFHGLPTPSPAKHSDKWLLQRQEAENRRAGVTNGSSPKSSNPRQRATVVHKSEQPKKKIAATTVKATAAPAKVEPLPRKTDVAALSRPN